MVEVQTLRTVYRYQGRELAAPDGSFSPEQVRQFYQTMFPELVTAEILGPDTSDGKLVYEFRRNVGTKG